MARLYDETRGFHRKCFDYALDFLVDRFPPQVFSNVFEPGIGNGRIAIPLAKRGYKITGVDISEEMLAAANNLEFERAALLRDQINELKRAVDGSEPPTKPETGGKTRYPKGRKKTRRGTRARSS